MSPPSVTIVGIAGGTASGKTTIAHALAHDLSAVLVAQDRYYHTASAATNFDHPDSLDNMRLVDDLRRLRAYEHARLPVYNFALHARMPETHWDEVTPKPIIIVEGILLLSIEALRSLLDIAIYVDAPDDIRLMRRIRRDVAERGRSTFDVLDQYTTTVRPMHERYVAPSRQHAHHVVDGTAPIGSSVVRIAQLLQERWR